MFSRQPVTADICLVLEGTYPYVSGGVSTWVHQVIGMFPDWKFAIFFLGAQHDPKTTMKYALPANVIALEEVYLFDDSNDGGILGGMGSKWRSFHESVRKLVLNLPNGDLHDLDILRSLLRHIKENSRVSFDDFWTHPDTWTVVKEIYLRYAPDDSFIDFYWSLRFLVQPLWKLARGLERLPPAHLYHSACTGYAGIAAAIAGAETNKPVLLTEHGIYLRERIGDICRSPWIPDQHVRRPNLNEPLGTLRRLWIGFFDVIGRMCYHQCDDIVSLFTKNADAQSHFGADPNKIVIIPNGIKTEEFALLKKLRDERRAKQPKSMVVGFLGRVVSIKDIKTLLRTARKVCDTLPDARFLIAGPLDEKDYYEECLDLQKQLNLVNDVSFLGPCNRNDFLPSIDVMALTSYSEGLPFVIIESLAAGIPVVSTDVGACSELLNGRPDESPAYGQAGLIAEIANTDELAAHIINLLTDKTLLENMTTAGLGRVEELYHERAIRQAYHSLYAKHLPAA
jgi:polysaccharide biosynthesis protein PelF